MSRPSIFTGRQLDVQAWIAAVESYFVKHKIPKRHHLSFARARVSLRVDACVQSLTRPLQRATGGVWRWTWPRYRVALQEIEKQIRRGGTSAEDVAKKAAAVIGTGVVACVAGPILLTAGLGALGFTSVGVVGGSVAAGIQSAIGGMVTSGSVFALCQSFAMGGAATVAAVTGVSGAAGITAATIKEIASKSPSKSWDDAGEFQPSETLLRALLSLHDDPDDYDDDPDDYDADLPMLINPHLLSVKDE